MRHRGHFLDGNCEDVGVGFQRLPNVAHVATAEARWRWAEADIVGKIGGDVGIRAAYAEEGFARAGEDIVPNHEFAAIVDRERRTARVVNPVVLENNVRASLVGINAPAAIVGGMDAANVISPHDGAGLDTEKVDSAIVAQDAFANIADEVVLNQEIARDRFAIAPRPPG